MNQQTALQREAPILKHSVPAAFPNLAVEATLLLTLRPQQRKP